ncbi:histidine kinase [Enterobacterales bacterium CwR94]|nr:histidine kinase [Enterobacterales bacterium CwR94]
MKKLLLLLLVFWIGGALAQNSGEPSKLRVVSRESYEPVELNLDDADWRWLGQKRLMKVAVWRPEIPPLDLYTQEGQYEGMTADYLYLISQSLGVRMEVLEYPARERALMALNNHEVDLMVDTSGKILPQQSDLRLSKSFISDHPVLVHRKRIPGELFKYTPGMRMAIARWYVDDAWLEENFPGVRIMHFDTDAEAMASVAFNDNDFFIGNLVTSSFLLDRNYTNLLEFQTVYPERDTGSRFVMRKGEEALLRTVNIALSSISGSQKQVIMQQWSEGADMWRLRKQIEFSRIEQNWITNHPEVKVSVNPFYAPFTMTDSQGHFYGVTADILRLIRQRTGIHFEPVSAESLPDMQDQVISGETLFIGALSHSEERNSSMLFTRPYFESPFVTVVREDAPRTEELPTGARVALVKDNSLIPVLLASHPGIKIIETPNASIAMQYVIENKADVAVHTLFGANYMVDRYFKGQLKIAGRIGNRSAAISFAVARNQPELLSILNKALENISPSDINNIIKKWQIRPDVRLDTWEIYRKQFWLVSGIAAILMLISLLWILSLRREIKARKRAEGSLHAQLKFNETLINTLPVPVFVTDDKGEIRLFNQSLRDFFKDSSPSLCASLLDDESHPLHSVWQEAKENSAETGTEETDNQTQTRYTQLDNGQQQRSVILHAVSYTDDPEMPGGMICTWIDVTEHEELNSALSEARERAEQANRAKSTFLATMSHEIRTPVSAIIGLLELAVKTSQPQVEKEESIRVAWESARSLMGLIGDILDMARIESGRLELAPEWVRTTDLLPPVIRVFEGLARQKSLRLNSTLPPFLPYEVFIDPLRFRQVLSNLVSNAIKFSEKGGITVDLDILNGQTAEQGQLRISVQDSGRGIAQDDLVDIFDPWVQTRAGKTQSGSGLGLAICAQLVHMMSGHIEMKSQLGKGTQVIFTIPVEIHSERSEPQPELPTVDISHEHIPLRILAVDDYPANRMLLRSQLLHLGHSVTEAEDGEEGWAKWQEGEFDVVITDCSMPGMDGLALTRMIRQHQTRPVIIMGLTANAWPEERSRCLAAGMDECLFKPLQLPQLEALLDEAARLRNPALPNSPLLGELLSFEDLATLTHHDEKMRYELLVMTLNSNREDLQQAADLFELEDWPELAKCIHRISGAAQIIGARRAETSCHLLEKTCLQMAAESISKDILTEQWQEARYAVVELNTGIEHWLSMQLPSQQ